jgi:arginine decarboxylase-like protein
MLGQTILHYKILEKLGEVPIRLDLASEMKLSPIVGLSIPSSFGGSGTWRNFR